MRTNIVIDDELIAEAMRLSGARTKREAVEYSLRLLVQLKSQERLRGAGLAASCSGSAISRPCGGTDKGERVVDTSVWIDYFNGVRTPQADRLDELFGEQLIAIGDLVR